MWYKIVLQLLPACTEHTTLAKALYLHAQTDQLWYSYFIFIKPRVLIQV